VGFAAGGADVDVSETAVSSSAGETEFSVAEMERASQTTAQTAAATTKSLVAQTSKAVTTTTTTQRAATAAPTAKPVTTTRATTTRRAVTTAAPAVQTQPPAPVYTEADYAEIIATVRQYAESKTSIKFVWDTSLTYERADQGLAGYHDMPNLTRTSKESVLADLKYHVDLTEANLTGGNGGAPSSEVHYNVYWFVDQQGGWGFGNNDICFVLVYG
jgi:hypothetical protein